jgi:hypothetical protein
MKDMAMSPAERTTALITLLAIGLWIGGGALVCVAIGHIGGAAEGVLAFGIFLLFSALIAALSA